eukprot:gene52771-47152_t
MPSLIVLRRCDSGLAPAYLQGLPNLEECFPKVSEWMPVLEEMSPVHLLPGQLFSYLCGVWGGHNAATDDAPAGGADDGAAAAAAAPDGGADDASVGSATLGDSEERARVGALLDEVEVGSPLFAKMDAAKRECVKCRNPKSRKKHSCGLEEVGAGGAAPAAAATAPPPRKAARKAEWECPYCHESLTVGRRAFVKRKHMRRKHQDELPEGWKDCKCSEGCATCVPNSVLRGGDGAPADT